MSKYCKIEDVIRWINAEFKFQDIPTIEVSDGVIGQGSGDINWQAVTSTVQEIYAKGYEDGRKSVEVSEDAINRFKDGQKDMLIFLLEGMKNALEKARNERVE